VDSCCVSVRLDDVSGALAVCDRHGTLIGASAAARDLLSRLGGDGKRVPATLWGQLASSEVGEAVVWSPEEPPGHVLGCTRYSVGTERWLLVMREITEKQELLAQQLQRHRAKTIELLVYLLAHDLRAPLASIVLNLDVLSERWRELAPEAVTEFLGESAAASIQLRETIDALVDLVRIGPPRATDLRVATVIDRAVGLTRPAFRQSGHELIVALDPSATCIRANELAVQQILMNLLLNAAESTTTPMAIELTTKPATLDGPSGRVGAVSIRVRDYGPGIAPEMQRRLFQPFFTTKSNGTGLGLALARDAAVAENGVLQYVPVATGACFEVILPSGRGAQ
jgi:signal transduction histidine kinase